MTLRRAASVASFAIATLVLWLSSIQWPSPPAPGLDESWQQVLSHGWVHGRRAGVDLLFTWGPLGWWWQPHIIVEALPAKLRFEVFGRLAVAGIATWAAWSLPWASRVLWIAVMAALLREWFDTVSVAIVTLLAVLWLPAARAGRPAAVALAVLGAAAVVKFTLFVLVVALGAGAATLAWLAGDRRRAAVIAAGLPAGIAAWWTVAGQRLGDLPAFLRGGMELAAGYGHAMAVEESTRHFVAGVAVLIAHGVAAIALTWTARDRFAVAGRLALVAMALFIAWKHGYTRADGHMLIFFGTASLLALVASGLPDVSAMGRRSAQLVAGGSLIVAAMTFPGTQDLPRRALNRVRSAPAELMDLDAIRARFAQRAAAVPDEQRLPRVVATVGDRPIDLIGHDQSLLYVNGLNHVSRPVIQSYSTYTGYLAELNRRFFASPSAPDFVLFSLRPIDGRYPGEDDARVLSELPARYEPLFTERGRLLLRRRDEPLAAVRPPEEVVLHQVARPGEPIRLPVDGRWAHWATIESTPTLAARVRGLLYRPPLLRMTLVDDSGLRTEHRLVPTLARDGFLLQPGLLDPGDASAWVHGSGRRWNLELTIGTGAGEDRHWSSFALTVTRLPIMIAPTPSLRQLVTADVLPIEPVAITPARDWRLLDDHLGTRLFMHAPAFIDLPVPGGARVVDVTFGLEPGAYTGNSRSDGVALVVESAFDDGTTKLLVRRAIDPLDAPADRGPQRVIVPLPSPPPPRVRLGLETGATGGWDWSYLQRVRFE